MAIKIYVSGNYLFAQQGSDKPLQDHKTNVFVEDLGGGQFEVKSEKIGGFIVDVDASEPVNYQETKGEAQDESGTPYTTESWFDFYTTNTGSSIGEDGGSSLGSSVLYNKTDVVTAGQTSTSDWFDLIGYPSISFSIKTDQKGVLYVDFSSDGVNSDSTLTYTIVADRNDAHKLTNTKRYCRFRVSNTSSSDQTYIRLQAFKGNFSNLTSPINALIQSDADGLTVRPIEFNVMVAEGLYENRNATVKDGLVSGISNGNVTADLWTTGGAYTGFPTSPAASEIVVAGADTGTVFYSYMATDTDTDYTFGSKAVTGAGTYSLGHNIWRCNYMLFVGSSGVTNVDLITVRQSSPNTSVIFATILAGYGQSFCAAYTVPFGSSIYLDRINGSVKGSASGTLDGFFWYREYNRSPLFRFPFELQFGALYFDDVDFLIRIPARTDLMPRIVTSSANALAAKVSYRFIKTKE